MYFYPRSPCGERLNSRTDNVKRYENFYPRSPCGERRIGFVQQALKMIFLSTLSLRRATNYPNGLRGHRTFLSTLSLRRATLSSSFLGIDYYISIHALLAESDRRCGLQLVALCYFYPRSPCGERRDWFFTGTLDPQFLSTLSLRRATAFSWWLYYQD